jgi:hypothetical protein
VDEGLTPGGAEEGKGEGQVHREGFVGGEGERRARRTGLCDTGRAS